MLLEATKIFDRKAALQWDIAFMVVSIYPGKNRMPLEIFFEEDGDERTKKFSIEVLLYQIMIINKLTGNNF